MRIKFPLILKGEIEHSSLFSTENGHTAVKQHCAADNQKGCRYWGAVLFFET